MNRVAPQSGQDMISDRQSEQRGLPVNIGRIVIYPTAMKGNSYGKIERTKILEAA